MGLRVMLGKLGLVWGPTNVGLNVFLDRKFKTFLGRSAPVEGSPFSQPYPALSTYGYDNAAMQS